MTDREQLRAEVEALIASQFTLRDLRVLTVEAVDDNDLNGCPLSICSKLENTGFCSPRQFEAGEYPSVPACG